MYWLKLEQKKFWKGGEIKCHLERVFNLDENCLGTKGKMCVPKNARANY